MGIVGLKKTENKNEKQAEDGPFFKDHIMTDPFQTMQAHHCMQ